MSTSSPSKEALMKREPQNESEYWHSPELQAEYLDLIDGKSPTGGTLPAGELADAAEVSERVSAAFEGIDTGALDSAFEGLSDEAQGIATAVLADPSQRESLIESMPIAALEELIDFVGRMPEDEQVALERALLLT